MTTAKNSFDNHKKSKRQRIQKRKIKGTQRRKKTRGSQCRKDVGDKLIKFCTQYEMTTTETSFNNHRKRCTWQNSSKPSKY